MPGANDGDERKMNDTTMPPPTQISSRAGGTVKAAVPARRKTGRFGLSEWNRLLRSSKDLAQLKGKPLRRIPLSEIRQHDSVYDGWIALRGKVYNISPYLAYHPGGEAILKKVLGRDCTSLYEKYHRWVSEEGLVGKLLIGYVDNTNSEQVETKSSYLPQKFSKDRDGFAIPAPKPPKSIAPMFNEVQVDNEEDEEDAVAPWEK